MIAAFDACVMHGQIKVCWNDTVTSLVWTDAHIAQGFAWSPVQVSFAVPDHMGFCRIEVVRSNVAFDATPALWAVQVPFDVLPKGLYIDAGFDPQQVLLPSGTYTLVFAAYPGTTIGDKYAFRFVLLFQPCAEVDFEILKCGNELTTDVVLRKDADPI